jgi:hypothetical protein
VTCGTWFMQSTSIMPRFVQDMPKGMHGIFPLGYGGALLIAGGGVKAAASRSALNIAYGLP